LSMLVDSHCHIPMIESSDGVDTILENARENGVEHMLCVSVDLEGLPEILELARENDCISASVGVHPNTRMEREISEEILAELAQNPSFVAIGETGLDYYRSEGDLGWQRQRFRTHIRAAKAVNKPLIIHCREAKDDVLGILREEGAEAVGGVMHCFVEDLETAEKAVDLNFLISFSGIVTFKNARDLQAVAKALPLESMLVETDAPYLAPVPYRGKENQPAYVRYVAECIAELRGTSLEEVAEATTRNFNKRFLKKNI
jgi:TatD DNase family protein